MDKQAMKQRIAQLLVEVGHITVDDYGYAHLTDQGRQRVGRALSKVVPNGDVILLELAVLEGHGVTVQI